MDKMISCAVHMDTACVEVKNADRSMLAINCRLPGKAPIVSLLGRNQVIRGFVKEISSHCVVE